MNVLIVDDDRYIIDGIVKGVNWDKLSVQNVYTAIGAFLAREILEKVDINVLVCDIEMPHESGLELVRWIRGQGFPVQVIFLTSYAEFTYAQQALELSSFQYVLKPVEYYQLALIIKGAMDVAEKEVESLLLREYGLNWLDNQSFGRENFWIRMLEARSKPASAQIESYIDIAHLDYSLESRFYLLWMELDFRSHPLQKTDESMFVYEMTNYWGQYNPLVEMVLHQTLTQWYVVLRTGEPDTVTTAINYLAERILNKRDIDGFLYLSDDCALLEIYDQIIKLKEIHFRNGRSPGIRIASDFEICDSEYSRPAVHYIEELLSKSDQYGIQAYVEEYLNNTVNNKQMSGAALSSFMMDYMQILFAFLWEKHVEANLLFADEKNRTYYQNAADSVSNMKDYIYYLTETALSYVDYVCKGDDVIVRIEEYIMENLDKNISRADLAQMVYLNVDYISRLFKGKKGIGLNDFIRQQKMHRAKQLLLDTTEPVYSIAFKVGYQTSSYFAKQFKDSYGVGPVEYRKERQR